VKPFIKSNKNDANDAAASKFSKHLITGALNRWFKLGDEARKRDLPIRYRRLLWVGSCR
jgi:hypothetical protein